MFRKISEELYENEIKKLREQNAHLLARCEHAEQYMNEYKELSRKSKELITEYKRHCDAVKLMEKEYGNLLEKLVKESRDELRLKQ